MANGDILPKAITAALTKLVRDRDRWRRRALDRAAVRSPARRAEIAARDRAVEQLLFGCYIEGSPGRGSSRGAWGCFYSALEALRPDVAAVYSDAGGGTEGARLAWRRFFPMPEDIEAGE